MYTSPSIERTAVAAVGLTFPFLLVAHACVLLVWHAMGRTDLPPAEWVSAIAVASGLTMAWTTGIAARLARRLPDALDRGARRHPVAAILGASFTVLALVQVGRVSAFMVDSDLKRDATIPTEGRDHMCLPAYVQAAELARAGDPNLYAASHYEAFAAKDLLSLLPASAYAHAGGVDPMHSHAVRIDSEQERDIFGSLRCTCGCPRDPHDLLSTCSCGVAESARGKVREELAAGMTKERVLLAYEQANGVSALVGSQAAGEGTSVEYMQDYIFDPYEYPPPFLLIPRAALAFTNDFRVIRTTWFILQALTIGAMSLAIARWIGGREGLVVGLFLPALWSSTPFLLNLQLGQLFLLSFALAMTGMAAFESRRDALGGALLGAAIVMKVVPGVLLIYLLARGRVRSVLAVGAWVVVYALLGLAAFGPAPYVAFFQYQLPRLASGEAFAFFLGRPDMLAGNFGVYALPLKLRGLGVPGMTLGISSALTWGYSLLLLLVTVLAARRSAGTRIDHAQRWLAVLNLAALRSPLAPYLYVTSGSIWLLTLLAPSVRRNAIAGLLAAWLYISVAVFAINREPLLLWNWTLGQIAVLVLNLWVAVRRPPDVEAAREALGRSGGSDAATA